VIRSLAAVLLLTALPALSQEPKNIILLIGDGLGPVHVDWAAELRKGDFRIATMPVAGLARTASLNRAVTDSAAGATALATGQRVEYEAVSMTAAGEPLPTILERAEQQGMATGLVTTSYFYDATPAAFAAHSPHRRNYADIAQQMVSREIDVIAGGGLLELGKEGLPSAEDLAAGGGYTLITDAAALAGGTGPRILALFPTERRNADFAGAKLADLTRWAISRLAGNPKGFVLIVEHEGIDSASHNNDSELLRAALTSLDEAVGAALDFAAGRSDTLVLVTGDHETGGLRGTETKSGRPRYEWSTTDHTASPVPVFASGPGAAAFAGFHLNTEVGARLMGLVIGRPGS
jgi:alkaline phosphatase